MLTKSLTVLALCSTSLFAQGSLTPPGGPAPSMKTLGQIEPRAAIEKLPFKISASGAYYLTGNLTVPNGTNGISIEADQVTIDFNGFTLKGGGSSFQAVVISGAHSDIALRNGIITGTDSGIWGPSATRTLIEKMQINGCQDAGINLGQDAIIRDCQADGNDGSGIQTGVGGQVIHCQANGNSGNGIQVDQKSTVRDCTVTRNGLAGVSAGDSATLAFILASDNSGNGITAGNGAHLIDCTVNANKKNGIGGGNLVFVTRASASYNLQYGLLVGDSASLIDSSVSGNAFGGIVTGNAGHVTNCKADANSGIGILVKVDSTVRDCSAQGNGNDGISVTDRCTVTRNNCAGNVNFKTAAGIHASGTDNIIQENTLTANDRGLAVEAEGNVIIKNTAGNNTLNYFITGDQSSVGIVTLDAVSSPNPLSNIAF